MRNYDDDTPIMPLEASVHATITPPFNYRKIAAISALNFVCDTATTVLKEIDAGLDVSEPLFARVDVLQEVATMLLNEFTREMAQKKDGE